MRQHIFKIFAYGQKTLLRAKDSLPKLTEVQSSKLSTALDNAVFCSSAFLWADMIWHGCNGNFEESIFAKSCAGAVKEFGEDAVILAL